jgi:hypothetical protein
VPAIRLSVSVILHFYKICFWDHIHHIAGSICSECFFWDPNVSTLITDFV